MTLEKGKWVHLVAMTETRSWTENTKTSTALYAAGNEVKRQ